MFEVDGRYANRIGNYTVVEINEPKMTVRYDDGTTAELRINIQERIWKNIIAEADAKRSRPSRKGRRTAGLDSGYFIKPINILAAEDLTVSGWQGRVSASADVSGQVGKGDRLLLFAIENQVFFAVATITAESFEAATKEPDSDQTGPRQDRYFQLDLDAHAGNLDKAISIDAVDFESQPDIKLLVSEANRFVRIDEDEFEIVAEMLSEVVEEEDEEEEEEEEEEEFED